MDPSIARALLGGFIGYSPVLPPIINSCILELYLAARDPARPRSGDERGTWEQHYALSLDMLGQHNARSTHAAAVEFLTDAWNRRDPFALYLRSFSYGARVEEVEPSEAGFFQRDTIDPLDDDRFQRWLAENVIPHLPVVSIENPAFELRRDNSLLRLSLTDEMWQRVITSIIPGATIIFLYIGSITEGIRWEIEALRGAGRQGETVLFCKEPILGIDLSDFRDPVLWGEDCVWQLNDWPHKIREARPGPYGELALPPAPTAPEIVRRHCDGITNMGLLAGRHMLDNGSFVDATDAFVASIAASFWGENPHARAFAHRYLAAAFLAQHKTHYAVDNLEHAIDLFERFARDNRASVAEVARDIREFDEVFSKFGEVDRVTRLQQRLARLQKSP
jgi:hypothetical protein